jgi:hypothetical protein
MNIPKPRGENLVHTTANPPKEIFVLMPWCPAVKPFPPPGPDLTHIPQTLPVPRRSIFVLVIFLTLDFIIKMVPL